MRTFAAMCLFCATVLLAAASALAQSPGPSAQELLTRFGDASNSLTRYEYLVSVIPRSTGENKLLAQQLLATVDSGLGLYNEAMIAFPFDNRVAPAKLEDLPHSESWQAADAAEAVVELAATRQLVMINEAHHDAHTRQLTLTVLPRLRALGFQYLAVEALGDKDPDLMRRGYVNDTTGSPYLLEPLYGEIIRQAIKLGYVIVPYDSATTSGPDRDAAQARILYEKVFAKDPQAKLLVHAGYSHIDKREGNLGNGVEPMAMQLKRLSGIDPLCIDQSQFRDVAVGGLDFGFYSIIARRFYPQKPSVLRQRGSNAIWTADPLRHDVTVILPPAAERDVESAGLVRSDALRREVILPRPPFDLDVRPPWLALEGKRQPYRIDTELCDGHIPCVIDAHYPGEPDNATPADRYTFLRDRSHNVLYLFPGRYRLRAWGDDGATLFQQTIEVASTH